MQNFMFFEKRKSISQGLNKEGFKSVFVELFVLKAL